jgi:hypothetical protein
MINANYSGLTRLSVPANFIFEGKPKLRLKTPSNGAVKNVETKKPCEIWGSFAIFSQLIKFRD